MARGDHIKVSRYLYTHHGIDLGDGWVIHYTGEVGKKSNASVQKDRIGNFANGGKVEVVKYSKSLPTSEIIRNAESRLGERDYSLVFSNCEHFARWCKTGEHKSEQLKDVASGGAGVGLSTLATGGGIAGISSAGAVAGLSGSGVMSGLATVGSYVGAGAVGGVVLLGAAPAAVTTLAMRKVLEDDEKLSSEERESRTAGRAATAVGAASGVAGSVAAISAGGVAGLSGAGITSGLAAIGSTVGGGMVAGTAMTVAAPAVAAAAVGYGVYKVFKWLKS